LQAALAGHRWARHCAAVLTHPRIFKDSCAVQAAAFNCMFKQQASSYIGKPASKPQALRPDAILLEEFRNQDQQLLGRRGPLLESSF